MQPEGLIIFMVVTFVSLQLFGLAVWKRYSALKIGRQDDTFGDHALRCKSLLVNVLGQRKVLWETYPGIMHLFIFWGFIVLAPGEIQFFGEGLAHGFSLPLLGKNPYFYLLQDIFCVLVLIGLMMAFYRRYIVKPDRLDLDKESLLIISLIAMVVITLLLGGGARAAITPEGYLKMAPVVWPIGRMMAENINSAAINNIYYFFWWVHVLTILTFLVFIPRSKHLHLIAAPFNIYFRSLAPLGASIKPIDFTNPDMDTLGASKIEDFSRKQLLDLYSCTKCGRCQDNCPAYLSNKPLSSKVFINKLKDHFIEKGDLLLKFRPNTSGNEAIPENSAGEDNAAMLLNKQLVGDVVDRGEIWSCTTCGACQYLCPVFVEHLPKRIELRRFEVMEKAEYPVGLQEAVRCLESRGHPYRGTKMARSDWYKDLDVPELGKQGSVDVLYWVGCTTALDERIMKIARAVVGLMQEAGVNFGLLGNDEPCCGDPARRIGNEYLYDITAKNNIELLNDYGIKTIVVNCPHCYNTFKNEYPRFGAKFTVLHHSSFLMQLLRQGRLSLGQVNSKVVTYHDPCYLGRYNDEFDTPRDLIKCMPDIRLVEMERTGKRSFCCGGGGGGAWLEEEGSRINHLRASQVRDTGAEVLCTACPFCMTMMEDGIKSLDMGDRDKIRVMDLAELLYEVLHKK